jgi:hypothetical protein
VGAAQAAAGDWILSAPMAATVPPASAIGSSEVRAGSNPGMDPVADPPAALSSPPSPEPVAEPPAPAELPPAEPPPPSEPAPPSPALANVIGFPEPRSRVGKGRVCACCSSERRQEIDAAIVSGRVYEIQTGTIRRPPPLRNLTKVTPRKGHPHAARFSHSIAAARSAAWSVHHQTSPGFRRPWRRSSSATKGDSSFRTRSEMSRFQ